MFVHQPLVVYLCVSECLCVCYIARRMMKVEYGTLQVCQVQYCQQYFNF